MKLFDIAKNIDKSKENECFVDIPSFSMDFGINFEDIEQERLKAYWVGNWYCTDTFVGYKIYFFDEEPVCFSIQDGRKSNEFFKWFSKELALKVREYLISIMYQQDDDIDINTCDINEDIGNSYKIHFNEQVLDWNTAMLKGEPVKFIERIKENPDWGIDSNVKIQLSNGKETIVNVKELDFNFHLNK